jgi:hypothetical protein
MCVWVHYLIQEISACVARPFGQAVVCVNQVIQMECHFVFEIVMIEHGKSLVGCVLGHTTKQHNQFSLKRNRTRRINIPLHLCTKKCGFVPFEKDEGGVVQEYAPHTSFCEHLCEGVASSHACKEHSARFAECKRHRVHSLHHPNTFCRCR